MTDPKPGQLLHSVIRAADDELTPLISEASSWLGDESWEKRKVALEVFGHVAGFRGHRPAQSTLEKIARLASDEDARVRAECASALSLIPNAPAEDREKILLALLEDEESSVQEEAAAAIGDLKIRSAREALAARVNNEAASAALRFESALALGMIGDARGVEMLIAALERRWDRVYACRALADLGDRRAVPALWKFANQWIVDFSERLHALGALYRLGELEAGEKIMARTRSWSRPEREHALWMAGHAGVKEAIPVLLELARQKKHKLREAAIRGLGALAHESAAAELEKIAHDNQEAMELRVEAVIALSEIDSSERNRILRALAESPVVELSRAAREQIGR
jgi:HEAT repeat protein